MAVHQSRVYGETEPREIVNAIYRRTGNGGEVLLPGDPFTQKELDRAIRLTSQAEYPEEFAWLSAIEFED